MEVSSKTFDVSRLAGNLRTRGVSPFLLKLFRKKNENARWAGDRNPCILTHWHLCFDLSLFITSSLPLIRRHFTCTREPWWPGGQISAPWPEDSRFGIPFHQRSVVHMGVAHVKYDAQGQASSRWPGVEVWKGGCWLGYRHLTLVQNDEVCSETAPAIAATEIETPSNRDISPT
ncbi:hypothetical protein AVEN_158228-1 [Araneus ventricosus]|uniref:Uncharacterized protein n=1 Tax=Araneus ventricosus TaxID=182803 RepID=A0A4Y2S4W7_ARAVE|nr:hypothetical protein AVEN_158228-1 [Araneus ventricosus]